MLRIDCGQKLLSAFFGGLRGLLCFTQLEEIVMEVLTD